jgi:hypothetical protein
MAGPALSMTLWRQTGTTLSTDPAAAKTILSRRFGLETQKLRTDNAVAIAKDGALPATYTAELDAILNAVSKQYADEMKILYDTYKLPEEEADEIATRHATQEYNHQMSLLDFMYPNANNPNFRATVAAKAGLPVNVGAVNGDKKHKKYKKYKAAYKAGKSGKASK